MRFFVLASLIFSACGETVSETVTSRLNEIKFSETRFGGISKGRQMMVQNLLQGISLEGQVSPTQSSTITDNVIPLLDNILAELLEEKVTDKNWLDNKLPDQSDYDRCLDPAEEYNTATQNAADAFTAFQGLSEEGPHWPMGSTTTSISKMAEDCTAFYDWFNGDSTASDSCTVPTSVSSSTQSIANWRTMMTTHRDTWIGSGKYAENFDSKYQACLSSYQTYTANKATADAKQIDFEVKMCAWNNALISMCKVNADCGNRMEVHHEVAKVQYEARDAVRVQNARSIRFVKCVLNEIASNNSVTNQAAVQTACPYDSMPDDGICSTATEDSKAICNFSAMPVPAMPTKTSCSDSPAKLLGNIDGTSGGTWLLAGSGPDLYTAQGSGASELQGSSNSGASDVKYDSTFMDTLPMNNDCIVVNSYWVPYGTKWDWQTTTTAGTGSANVSNFTYSNDNPNFLYGPTPTPGDK